MKSKNCALKILKRILIGYNDYIIYKIYIKDQKKVIWIKNLLKITKQKPLPNFLTIILTFQSFLSEDNKDKRSKDLINTYNKSQKIVNAKGK